MRSSIFAIAVIAVGFSLAPEAVHAVTFVQGSSLSSPGLRVLDSQHGGFKASASSDSFRLLSTIGDVAIGVSSGSSFSLRSGFLYYPLVIAPVLTGATPGTGQVSLAWTAAQLDAGWAISGYNVCRKTTGAYTCEDVGLVTAFIKTGLTGGTSYTFKVQVKEAFGTVVAESQTLSAIPTGGGGGGGGGGSYTPPSGSSLSIVGYAYPGATVTILRDGLYVTTVTAAADGTFTYVRSGISAGTYTYGFWAQDTAGRRSVVLSIPITISATTPVNMANLVIAPTIEFTTADSVPAGGTIGIRGSATPGSTVRILVNPGNRIFTTTAAPAGVGTYSYSFATTGLLAGGYNVSARTEFVVGGGGVSQYSQLMPFGIGVPAPVLPGACGNPPDISRDSRVNLVDFSVLAFWWKRTPLPALLPFDLSCDGKVGLDDFSILAYHWTG